MSNNNPYGQTCRADIPYPSVSSESVPSLIDNLVNALYGTITKTVVDRKVVWDIPCDPDNTATVFGIPRLTGEGLLCYFIRVFNEQNLAVGNLYGGAAGSLPYQAGFSDTTFLPIGTVGYALTSNGSAPVWSQIVAQSALASNISGGTAGQLLFQLATNSTAKLPIGLSGTVLTSSGSAPFWAQAVARVAPSTGNVDGALLYQYPSSLVTRGLVPGSAGSVLVSGGPTSAPEWQPANNLSTNLGPSSGNSAGAVICQAAANISVGVTGSVNQVLTSNGTSQPTFKLLTPSNLSTGAPSWSSSGKLTLTSDVSTPSLNIGVDKNTPSPIVSGDVYIGATTMRFVDNTGIERVLANRNTQNTFSSTQVISVADNTTAALRVTQTGTGESFRVEDSANPDATPFVISAGGQVGIGVTPDASVCLSLGATGVKFADGSIQTTSGIKAKGQLAATGTTVQPGSLNIDSINASTVGQKVVTFSAAAGVTGTSSVVATLSGASNGFIRVSAISANTATIQTANTAGAATDLAFSIAVF